MWPFWVGLCLPLSVSEDPTMVQELGPDHFLSTSCLAGEVDSSLSLFMDERIYLAYQEH